MRNREKTEHKNIHKEWNKYVVNIMRDGKIYRKSFALEIVDKVVQ